MLVKATVAVVIFAVIQAPVRLAIYAAILWRSRRVAPQLFDGPACAAAVAACLDDYQRERDPLVA